MKANSKEIVCSLVKRIKKHPHKLQHNCPTYGSNFIPVKRMTKMDTMCTYLPTFR